MLKNSVNWTTETASLNHSEILTLFSVSKVLFRVLNWHNLDTKHHFLIVLCVYPSISFD